VIFTSDNGPWLYESDVQRFGHDSSGGLRGMKADAWECGHRMPLIVRWPGKVAANSVSHQTISFVDFLATADELVGANVYQTTADTDVGPDSFSFLSQWTGKPSDAPKRPSWAMQSGKGLMTIRRGQWKYIDGEGSGGFSDRGNSGRQKSGKGQLYDLANDLGETTNLVDQHPEIVQSLKAELASIVQSKRSRDLASP
ncbi:MAG: sulfatase-like hydrolase/transferase, partial [Planctomycetales bacterium]|nr:sulfatase-like hydrolase/transferase [Planctomycetales bacterium]